MLHAPPLAFCGHCRGSLARSEALLPPQVLEFNPRHAVVKKLYWLSRASDAESLSRAKQITEQVRQSRHCDRSICSLLRSVGTTQGQPTCVVAGTLVFPIPTPPAHLSHPRWLQQAGGQNVRGPDELEGGWSATDHGHMTGIDLLIGTSSANVFADAMVEPWLPRAGCRFSTTRSLQQDCWRTLAQGSP